MSVAIRDIYDTYLNVYNAIGHTKPLQRTILALTYYLLKASNGDSRDAFQAGITPAAMLNCSERTQT